MSNFTNYAENKFIDHLFRDQALSNPSTWHVALFTAVADAEAGTVTEIATGSYARAAIACSLANFAGTQGAGSTTASTGTSGATSNNGVITFPAPTADWGQATHIGLYDASTAGNAWIIVALTTPKTINNGDPAPTFPAASLGITVA